ncbi:delta-like protein C [Syngnathoides biaculeatus]|uniref:delta-like protein C n=1 Tax=Syngnathoides biaculeatus TaxID=300417 RepID=UPI002ADE2478|nr:delta-like protein C [Syngnathoides biaculeatus]
MFFGGVMQARYLLLVILLRATTTASSGVFELKIESLTGTSARAFCGPSGACHLFFRVCLKHAQDVIDPEPPCTYGAALTEILPADPVRVAGSAPVRVPFRFKWPGTFSLILEAWSAESPELNSTENHNNLISRLATRRQLRVGEDWSQDVHSGERGSVRYSYRAVCDQHYHGDACTDYCRPRNDTFGHFSCRRDGRRQCLDGWAGDYCTQPICAAGCSAEHGSCEAPGECACHQGWRGDLCDQCARHPGCVHGTCRQPWQCDCEEGWGGLYCDQDLNYCTNHKPCQNGASCTNTGRGSYTCACRPGFSGNNCEREKNPCDSAPCRNGGSCKDAADGYVCACPLGFSGPDCGTGADLTCADEPCFNRGVCVTAAGGGGGGGYTCRCPPGYAGSNCEMKNNRCGGEPCANGGECVDSGGVLCRCRPGFAGPRCETNVDDCASNPCRNAGTCADGVADFKCTCTLGFEGKDCSLRASPCDRFPCRNGGRCFAHFSGPVCQCPSGFMGARCEYAAEPESAAPSPRPPRDPTPAALAAACVLGTFTLGFLAAGAVFVLRQLRRGRELAAMSASVKNDLEAVNNQAAAKESFLLPGGHLKVSNKDAALSRGGADGGAVFKNKMATDCNLTKEQRDKFDRPAAAAAAAAPSLTLLQDVRYQPVFVIPEQLERHVYATEV